MGKLDANGDSLLSYHAVNLVLENGALRGAVVGVFGASTQSYSSNGMTIIWPGGLIDMPTDTAQGFNTVWLLVGACVTALVLMTGLVVLVRRKKAHLQAIILMLLTEVGQLVFSECMAIANLATDWIVFDHILHGDLKVSSEIYMAAYATILCFGIVSTALSFCYRLRNARLVRTHLQGLAPQGEALATKDAHRRARQHEWELAQTHRTKLTLSLALLSVVAQGAPAKHLVRVRASARPTGRRALQICRCLYSTAG